MTKDELKNKVEDLVWEAFNAGIRCGDARVSRWERDTEHGDIWQELQNVQRQIDDVT